MYFQYLSDETLQDVLVFEAQKGIHIRIILDKDFFADHGDTIDFLRQKGIELFPYQGTTMHGKAILVDEKTLFIGSVNFSTYSFDNNRETGLIFSNPDIIEQFSHVFEKDIIKQE